MTFRTFIAAAIAVLGIAGTGLGERGGAFSVEQKLLASDGAAYDYFGYSVAISGETALVGAVLDGDNGDDSGSAYIYERESHGSWNEVAKLTASDGAASDWFGYRVAISGEIALVGAYGDDNNGNASGSAYLYQRQGDGSWNEVAKLTASDGAEYDNFGYSVAISGETALVGARSDDDNGGASGSAYIYQRQGDDSWNEVAKLTASESWAAYDYFGYSVAISGETALVGAYKDDDNGDDSGSAYIFGPPAPPATGACCAPTGCEILTLEQCSNMGGVFMAGESCEECDPVCLGDVNGDGQVNVADLLTVIANWNNCL